MQIYSSLNQKKTVFRPVQEKKICIYACGMTVYDYCHIGHARSMIVFDVAVRYWRSRGYEVQYVRNITDIDDKIISRSLRNNEPWNALAKRFITAMHEDEHALGLLVPDHEPRATEYISKIITLIKKILDQGHAYVSRNGDVCFDVRSFKKYGALSHRNVDELAVAANANMLTSKRNPLDFVLWKTAKPDEPFWSSPWGDGRPGWHIECSAMSMSLLGHPFDIHGGGMDLKFPHHENEIAQSEVLCESRLANYWMHVGLLQVDGEKMSKSLGNFFTIREVLENHSAELLRYFMISGHYRSPVNYSEANLASLKSSLDRLYNSLHGLPISKQLSGQTFAEKFHEAMDDDLNTPLAISVLFDLAHHIQRCRNSKNWKEAADCGNQLVALAKPLGLLQEDPETYFKNINSDEDFQRIESLITARDQARFEKKWHEADRIRDHLTKMNIVIEDTNVRTLWRRK